MTVGFIGLGRMGRGMAQNLARAGVPLLVYDLDGEAMAALAKCGAECATDVADVGRRASVIFTSLPGPAQVEEVLLGKDGIAETMMPGTTVFDLSTSSVSLARRIHGVFASAGSFMMDAPVSGGPAGAETGNLVVWVGGERAAFDRHVELLGTFSKHPHYVGPIGSGAITKLAHNMLGYTIQLAQIEVFSMAVKAGLDPLDLWQALRLGVVGKGSPLDMMSKQVLPGMYDRPAFALKLAHKDVTLATSLAKELGVPMRLSNLTLEEMTEALAKGFGDWDSRSYLQLQLERAGVAIQVEPERLEAAIQALST